MIMPRAIRMYMFWVASAVTRSLIIPWKTAQGKQSLKNMGTSQRHLHFTVLNYKLVPCFIVLMSILPFTLSGPLLKMQTLNCDTILNQTCKNNVFVFRKLEHVKWTKQTLEHCSLHGIWCFTVDRKLKNIKGNEKVFVSLIQHLKLIKSSHEPFEVGLRQDRHDCVQNVVTVPRNILGN